MEVKDGATTFYQSLYPWENAGTKMMIRTAVNGRMQKRLCSRHEVYLCVRGNFYSIRISTLCDFPASFSKIASNRVDLKINSIERSSMEFKSSGLELRNFSAGSM